MFPIDMGKEIVKYLDYRSVTKLSVVCKFWHKACEEKLNLEKTKKMDDLKGKIQTFKEIINKKGNKTGFALRYLKQDVEIFYGIIKQCVDLFKADPTKTELLMPLMQPLQDYIARSTDLGQFPLEERKSKNEVIFNEILKITSDFTEIPVSLNIDQKIKEIDQEMKDLFGKLSGTVANPEVEASCKFKCSIM